MIPGGYGFEVLKFEDDDIREIARIDLTEQSLEQMLISIKRETDRLGGRISLRPTRLIVHPSWTREQVEERLARLL